MNKNKQTSTSIIKCNDEILKITQTEHEDWLIFKAIEKKSRTTRGILIISQNEDSTSYTGVFTKEVVDEIVSDYLVQTTSLNMNKVAPAYFNQNMIDLWERKYYTKHAEDIPYKNILKFKLLPKQDQARCKYLFEMELHHHIFEVKSEMVKKITQEQETINE